MSPLTRLRTWLRSGIDKWLFQLRDAERGAIRLGHRRVFIVPSGPGLGFGLMVIVLFIGSVNYSLNLGFLLTYMIAGLIFVDMHFTFRNMVQLCLSSGRAQPVFAGEKARFELHVSNPTKHDRFAIALRFNHEDDSVSQMADIGAYSTVSTLLSTPALKRGLLAAPRIRLQTKFPLGLFRAWSYWRPEVSVLVYPRPEDNAPPLPLAADEESEGSGAAGREDFAGIRNYQAGDSLKRLAWRQIARLDPETSDSLLTKHFDGGGASELTIDFRQLPPSLDVESKLSRMTRWVLEAEAHGLTYSFHLDKAHMSAANGPAHLEACLQALALYEAAP
ncbi:MAG: hypothetical protein K0S28_1577 [Paucimonas sp.]|nr:hypothetical protein [Paucimonas sp.]